MGTDNHAAADTTPVYRAARIVLQAGFAISAALIVASIVLSIFSRKALPTTAAPLGDIIRNLADGKPGALAELGIIAVILTPIATTISIIASFLRIGDRRYAAVSGLVLVVLAISLTVALLR